MIKTAILTYGLLFSSIVAIDKINSKELFAHEVSFLEDEDENELPKKRKKRPYLTKHKPNLRSWKDTPMWPEKVEKWLERRKQEKEKKNERSEEDSSELDEFHP